MMTNKSMVLVPRELLEHACNAVEYLALRADEVGTSNVPVADALRAIIAAPAEDARAVVDEPVDALLLSDCVEMPNREYGGGYFGTEVVQLYRHPQRPVVVPNRKRSPFSVSDEGWNDCIDEIERLNK